MADLIDRTELLSNADVFTMHTKEYGSIEVISVDAVGDVSSVDALPVVRCKDCKHREDKLYCRLRKPPVIVTNVDFCSYGERRDSDV